MRSTTQQILIVDGDHELVQRLREALEQSGYRVLVAQDGEAALSILRREQPDLVLVDLKLPGYDGQDGTGVVRGDGGLVALPIVRLRDHQGRDRVAGWELGTGDPVTESFDPREIVARVRTVLHRAQEEPPPRRVLQAGDLVIDLDRRQVRVGDQPVHLTPTELGLLQALAERPGHTLSRLEMIENGLGTSYEGVDRTVDSHVKNLRRKLARAGATAGMVETVFGVGYRLATGHRVDAGANP
jgi:two-component system alkaline phosphatase synthesis response regulator PhoP